MKDIKPKFLDKLEENQLAQEINSIEEINNNPVITKEDNNPEPIIPSLSDEEIREMVMDEWENKTDIIEEEPTITLNKTEDMTDPNPVPPINPDEGPTGTPEPVIERSKNNVRIMNGNFPF